MQTPTANSSNQRRHYFLWLSDIHYDPYYGTEQAVVHRPPPSQNGKDEDDDDDDDTKSCITATASPYGQVGCDAPYRLIEDALQWNERQKEDNNEDMMKNHGLDFVIVTGDFIRHHHQDNTLDTVETMLRNTSQLLRQHLPTDLSIVPSVGNNDLTPDYYLNVDEYNLDVDNGNATETNMTTNPLLAMLTRGFDELLETDQERLDFERGGYLARNLTIQQPQPPYDGDSTSTRRMITVLSLNTIIYSTNHKPDQSYMDDPLGQFSWLAQQLETARYSQRVVYIIGHIPPAMGSFHHSQLWHEHYARQYFDILAQYDDTDYDDGNKSILIAGQFFGHLHSDEFRLIQHSDFDDTTTNRNTTTTKMWPMWLASSITPIYGSNPSIRYVSYEPSNGQVLDHDTYYLDLTSLEQNLTEADNATSTRDGSSSSPTWTRGSSFRESFGMQDLSTASMLQLIQDLNVSASQPDSPLWQALMARQHAYAAVDEENSSANDDDNDATCRNLPCRRAYICTMTTLTLDDFTDCVTAATAIGTISGEPGPSVAFWTGMSLLKQMLLTCGIATSFILLLLLFQRHLRRRQRYSQHLSVNPHHDGCLTEIHSHDNVDMVELADIGKNKAATIFNNGHSTIPHPPELT